MVEIVMPRLGLNMEKGMVLKWHVKEGDSFRKDDVLCEVESEKSISDVTADFDGKVIRILVKENEEAEVIKPIAGVEQQWPDGSVDRETDVEDYCDGVKKHIKAGDSVEITTGNSITRRPYL